MYFRLPIYIVQSNVGCELSCDESSVNTCVCLLQDLCRERVESAGAAEIPVSNLMDRYTAAVVTVLTADQFGQITVHGF